MVQVISASTLPPSGSNSWCGSTHFLGKHLRLTKQIHGIFGVGSPCLWYQGAQKLPFIRPSDLSRDRNLRVEAGWIFRGRDQGSEASSERSESTNEDILIFFFQLDLATQVQVGMLLQCLPLIIVPFTWSNNPSITPDPIHRNVVYHISLFMLAACSELGGLWICSTSEKQASLKVIDLLE